MTESHDPFMPSRVEDNGFLVVRGTVPSGIGSGVLPHHAICNACCGSSEGSCFRFPVNVSSASKGKSARICSPDPGTGECRNQSVCKQCIGQYKNQMHIANVFNKEKCTLNIHLL